jgi:hypothetical protein
MSTSRHLSSNPSVELMPWHPDHEDCAMCDAAHSSDGGIDTLGGWICYQCAAWMNAVTGNRAFPQLVKNPGWRQDIDATA